MSLPAVRGAERKEIALQGALEHLAPGPWLERPDAPDALVTAVRRLPPVEARYAPFPETLDARLRAAFDRRGITELYSHQAEALAHVAAGRNIVVTTPTASGKTLCYNLPVLDAVLQESSGAGAVPVPDEGAGAGPDGGAARARQRARRRVGRADRRAHLRRRHAARMRGARSARARTSCSATRHAARGHPAAPSAVGEAVREPALRRDRRAARVSGVFGSHLCNVLRRLRRIARHYGSDPQFICSSATIANPRELAERLAERPFALVSESGAPRGEKFFVFVNPPVVNRELGIRRSYLAETRRVAGEFLRRRLQMIVFAQSRLSTEMLTTYLKEDFEDVPGMPEQIRGYRGGYLPLRRREIERGLREGRCAASCRPTRSSSASTSARSTSPCSRAIRARLPRPGSAPAAPAGASARSAAVLVGSSAPIDQFVVRHPSYFFDASPEHALINPDNLHILVEHVKCAAFELPFSTRDAFGTINVQDVLARAPGVGPRAPLGSAVRCRRRG